MPGGIPPHFAPPENEAGENETANEQPALEAPPIIPEQHRPQSHAHQYSPFEQEMLNNMNALNLNYTQLREEVGLYRNEQTHSFERIEEPRREDWCQYEEDQRRTFGPIYSYIAHQGNFNSMTTPPLAPSWYNPTEWGYFGGSTSSGGGGEDGYNGDHMDEDTHYRGYGGFFDGGDAGEH
ncbi:unnamed protein product [Cuscuta europaea]|uniref:Uncharacterized protein n=1 Tax=Cuscuta europaea TaxID=41803 RepID=A0A9P1E3L8_CUSEU|nr:unnamed protein product [Cuscuta europaea]